MLPPRRRRGPAYCLLLLLLLAVACIFSLIPVAGARPAPTTTPHRTGHHHGSAVSRYTFLRDKPRWTRPGQPMSLTYGLSPTATVDYLQRDAVRATLRSAFATWAEAIPVSFVETEGSFDAVDIKVGFYDGDHGDGSPFDGPLDVVAHAFGPENGCLDFDAAEHWTVDLSADRTWFAIDLETVATHEIGHILGLDHSSSMTSVMYPEVGMRERKVHLSIDDVMGIQGLYGVNPNFSLGEYYRKDLEYNQGSSFWQLGLAYFLLVPF